MTELTDKIVDKITDEVIRAEHKHPDWPECMFRQVAIVNEESGELTRAVLHLHYEKGTVKDVEKELIQTAAMCIRMLKNLNP